jgi:enamine deaminase RidA (YjgF/YER057c/UK114 family)
MSNGSSETMRFVNPPELAAPPGYSNVVEVRAGRLVYIAGQAALDREGKLVGKDDFEAQTEQVFRNLSAASLRWAARRAI